MTLEISQLATLKKKILEGLQLISCCTFPLKMQLVYRKAMRCPAVSGKALTAFLVIELVRTMLDAVTPSVSLQSHVQLCLAPLAKAVNSCTWLYNH